MKPLVHAVATKLASERLWVLQIGFAAIVFCGVIEVRYGVSLQNPLMAYLALLGGGVYSYTGRPTATGATTPATIPPTDPPPGPTAG